MNTDPPTTLYASAVKPAAVLTNPNRVVYVVPAGFEMVREQPGQLLVANLLEVDGTTYMDHPTLGWRALDQAPCVGEYPPLPAFTHDADAYDAYHWRLVTDPDD